MAPNNFRVEAAQEDDISNMVKLITPSFSFVPVEQLLGNTEDPSAIQQTTKRHIRTVQEHKAATGLSPAIKCVHTDTSAGKETMVACAYWFIYPTPRSEEELHTPIYLLSADWVPNNDDREKAQKSLQPTLNARIKWSRGRGIGFLMYMATHPSWRRRGAATACVQWGIDRCRELGVPAYLEASEEGKPVYERLGFEVVDHAALEMDGVEIVFPVMMLWPSGTREEDKRVLGG